MSRSKFLDKQTAVSMSSRRGRSAGRTLLVAMLLASSVSSTTLVAYADGVADEADLHFTVGSEAYHKGDYRTALEHFLASNRLVPNHNVMFNIARMYDQLGRYAEAHRYYIDAMERETDAKTLTDIREALVRIAPKVAVLRIESDPPGAMIYIKKRDLGSRGRTPKPLAVTEGTYRVIVELSGYEPLTIDDVKVKIGAETKLKPVLRRIVGTVDITVDGAPGAAVHVDDDHSEPACYAPCTLDLPPGPHLLHFERRGFEAPPRQVMVTAREKVKVITTLRPYTGTVVAQADERDAVVKIDGKAMAFTPAVIPNVAVGKHKVEITLRGYAPIVREIEVRANQQTQLLDLSLIPLREVVAASRYTEQIDDAPSSVSVIDERELRAFGYPTLWEALRGIRGVALSNDRTYQSASIRGLGEPNDYGNRMLVLQDGAVLNDNLLNSTYIGTDGRPDLLDIERIEVIRGPGSLLYGANAMSGVVNMVPRGKDRPNSVHGSIGTYDNSVLRGRLGFHYNFSPDVGVWASLSGSSSEGIESRVLERGSLSPVTVRGVDHHRAVGTAGRFWAGPFTAQWYYNQNKHRVPIGAYGARIGDIGTFLDDERFMGEVRFEPQITPTLQLLLRAHVNHYDYEGEYIFDPVNIERLGGTWFGGEGRAVWTPTKTLRITVGGEVQGHTNAAIWGYYDTGETYVDERHPYRIYAPYAIADWGAKPWLRLSLGVRYNYFDYNEPPEDVGTPVFRGAAIVKPTKSTTIKLMGGNSFRAASIYEQFYHDGEGKAQVKATDPSKGLSIGPEHIYTGEIELSQRFRNDFSLVGSAWISRVDDILNSITVDWETGQPKPNSSTQRYVNSTEPALVSGADLELRREWRQGWFLSAFYSYQRARYLPSAEDRALHRNPRLVNAPEHLAAARAVIPVVPEIASLGARLTLEAPRRISLNSDEVTRTAVTADVTLSGNIRRFGVGYVLGVYNVADQRYDYINAASYTSALTRQNGRTVLLNLTAQYP